MTTTAHFVGSGHFQAVNPSREHTLHAPDIRSDIRFGPWRRCSHRCSHLLGSRGQSYSTCQRRHGRNLMSDRTSGAWRVCSLDGLTAWKCPEPTKWAVVVKDGARGREANSQLGRKHLIFMVRGPCAKYHHSRKVLRSFGLSGKLASLATHGLSEWLAQLKTEMSMGLLISVFN